MVQTAVDFGSGFGAEEALRVAGIGLVEDLLALLNDLVGQAVVQHLGLSRAMPL